MARQAKALRDERRATVSNQLSVEFDDVFISFCFQLDARHEYLFGRVSDSTE